jgi:hypothetical protein
LDPTTVGLDSSVHRSQRYLAAAYDAVANLIEETYPALRNKREGSRGRLTHAEQDVFRAAVIFAGAGVDTVFKEALRGCVTLQIESSTGAREKYLEFVTNYIQDAGAISPKRLALLLTSFDSSQDLKAAYIESLTGSSLQSQQQVTKALAALGLQDERDLFKDSVKLNPLFRVRNQIAHEMDMTPASVSGRGARSRHERSMSTYVEMCHGGLNYCQRVLNRLEAVLRAGGATA